MTRFVSQGFVKLLLACDNGELPIRVFPTEVSVQQINQTQRLRLNNALRHEVS